MTVILQKMFKYQKLADLLKTLIIKKAQLKDLIYSSPNSTNKNTSLSPTINPAVAYSNLSLILNNLPKFEQMFQSLTKKLNKKKQDKITNKYLLFVMVAQLMNVGKIVGGGRIKKVILQNVPLLPDIKVQSKINRSVVNIRLRKGQGEESEKWSKILSGFQSNKSVPGLFNLTHLEYSQLTAQNPEIRTSPACVVQSFSSNLPPFVLFQGLETKNQGKKFDIIDACSAPGNKTLQLSDQLSQRGVVYAFEKDQRRFGTLCKNMKKYEAKNVKPLNQNFLQTLPENYKKVKLILLDPSCSGSGMLTNFTRDSPEQIQQEKQLTFEEFVSQRFEKLPQKQKQRVLSLKKFQLELLDHTVKFNPQRISYSTCSLFCQENQQVVEEFLTKHPQYQIKNIIKNLVSHESLVSGFGNLFKNCLRIDPRTKVSDGFFVCVFARRKP